MPVEDCPGCSCEPFGYAPHNGRSPLCPPKPGEDWTSVHRVPLGYNRRDVPLGETPDPRIIQSNLFTLAQIGGLYDLIALEVEKQHLVILTAWRLDSGAPRAIDYIRNRGQAAHPTQRETSENA